VSFSIIFQVDEIGCPIVTVGNDALAKLSLIGREPRRILDPNIDTVPAGYKVAAPTRGAAKSMSREISKALIRELLTNYPETGMLT
jgi:hypothetical protein